MHQALPEVDVYGAVHKGVRYALLDLLRRMGTVSPLETANVEMVLDDLDGLFYLCAAHAEHEERFVHQRVEERAPGALARFDTAHAALSEVLEAMRALMVEVQGATPETRAAHYRHLYLRYASFVAQALEHMTQEELEIQPLLDRLFTADEVREIYATISAAVGPEELRVFLRVMIPAATPVERVSLLAQPKAALSREDFEALMQTVRRCLTSAEARDLERRLEQAE